MLETLSKYWWVLALRGLAAVVFGVMALIWPAITVTVLVLLFGVYSLVDGAAALGTAIFGGYLAGNRRWWVVLEGIFGVLAGVVAFAWPGITAIVLLALIATWALITGVMEIAAAWRLRDEITGEWLLALSGALSVLFGLAILIKPGAGALAVVWLIGIYAILFGVTLVTLGWRLRTMQRSESWSGAGRPPDLR